MDRKPDIAMDTMDTDWFGGPAPCRPRWALCVRGGDLCFRAGADLPPICLETDSGGGFVEGLWEGDVAELFLLNPATGFYVEFNLSPRGSWWCCPFDAPRERTAPGPAPLPGARTESTATGAGWDSAIAVPLASLPAALAFDPGTTRGNITFCLGRPPSYFTAADLGGGAPDFHRPDKWVALKQLLVASC